MIHPFRNFSLILLAILVCFFSNCSNKTTLPQNTFGELDSARIASDTGMQADMDLSYEYIRTLVQNDSVVYDFLAYDKPKGQTGKEWESRFHIIRRTSHSEDTVVKGFRSAAVRAVWLSDLDHNGQAELMFYEYPKTSKKQVDLIAYEMGTGPKARLIEVDLMEDLKHYRGNDTFFVYQDHLIRRYPYYEHISDSLAKGNVWQSYRLHTGKLFFENEKVGE